MYSIQHLMIKFDRSVVFSTNKTDRRYITEILLNVALNTINQTIKIKILFFFKCLKIYPY